jgi:hypothetical protein
MTAVVQAASLVDHDFLDSFDVNPHDNLRTYSCMLRDGQDMLRKRFAIRGRVAYLGAARSSVEVWLA